MLSEMNNVIKRLKKLRRTQHKISRLPVAKENFERVKPLEKRKVTCEHLDEIESPKQRSKFVKNVRRS